MRGCKGAGFMWFKMNWFGFKPLLVSAGVKKAPPPVVLWWVGCSAGRESDCFWWEEDVIL